MTNIITLETTRAYSTEKNLEKALIKLGLDSYGFDGEMPCRYIKCRRADGRWTAVFLISEYFRENNTGGYVGFASQFGFMCV